VKTLRYAVGIALVGFVGLTIYRAFFMPTQTTKQETHIIAQPGAQVTVDQKREEKKSGVEVSPFVEGYGFAESDNRKGVGARLACGLSSKETPCQLLKRMALYPSKGGDFLWFEKT